MGRSVQFLGLFLVVTTCLANGASADAVALNGEVPTSQSQGQLTLKSVQGVELRVSFIKVASAIVGAEAGVSVTQVKLEVMSAPQGVSVRDGVFAFSTTCTRIAPGRGSPFQNQQSQNFRLTFGPHQLPEVFIPLSDIVLQKNVHGGEFHTCEANLAWTINGVTQVDPVNRTTTFHPMF